MKFKKQYNLFRLVKWNVPLLEFDLLQWQYLNQIRKTVRKTLL